MSKTFLKQYFLIVFLLQLHFFAVTAGTQAAVLAGLDITMFIEFIPHADADWVLWKIEVAVQELKRQN